MPLRKAHYIYPLKSTDRPTRAVFLSTRKEQIMLANGLALYYLDIGYAKYCRTRRGERLREQSHHVITDPYDFWEWVTGLITTKSNLHLIAPKLAEDFVLLKGFTILPELGFKVDMAYISDSVAMVIWSNDKGKLFCLDNANLFRGTLERWQTFATADPPVYHDDMTITDEHAEQCRYEADLLHSLYDQWFQLLDDHDLGPFKMTVASQALASYRYRFMSHKILAHDNADALKVERAAYRGGRVECFRVGHFENGPFYYLDVNSMYGFVMREYQYPAIFWGQELNPPLSRVEYRLNTGCVVAYATITPERPHFPYKRENRYVYPLGKFRAFLTTPELEYALNKGWVNEVHILQHYAPAPLFRDYANYFFKTRQAYREAGQLGLEEICKLMVNSLYGKMGQRGYTQTYKGQEDSDSFYLEPSYYIDAQKRLSYLHLGGAVFEIEQTAEAYQSVPAIAAHITAYARMKLASVIDTIGRENLLYVDTDGVITNEAGKRRVAHLLSDNVPGMLKIETVSSWVTIHSPKDYEMEGRIRRKGLTSNAVQIAEGEFQDTLWHRLGGLIQDGMVDTISSQQIVKKLSRKILSGQLLSDGRVVPFVVADPLLPPLPPPLD